MFSSLLFKSKFIYFFFFLFLFRKRRLLHSTSNIRFGGCWFFFAFFFADTFLICCTETQKLIECTGRNDFEKFLLFAFHCDLIRHSQPFSAIQWHYKRFRCLPVGGLARNYLFNFFFVIHSMVSFFFARNDNSFFSSSISHQSIYIYKENLANDVSFDRSLSVSKPFLSHSQLYLTVRVLTESHIFFTLLFHSYERWGDLSACASCCFHVVFVGSECCAHRQFQV